MTKSQNNILHKQPTLLFLGESQFVELRPHEKQTRIEKSVPDRNYSLC